MTGLPSSDCALCATGQLMVSTGEAGAVGLSPQLAAKPLATSSRPRTACLFQRNVHLAAEAARVARIGIHFRRSEHDVRLNGQRNLPSAGGNVQRDRLHL